MSSNYDEHERLPGHQQNDDDDAHPHRSFAQNAAGDEIIPLSVETSPSDERLNGDHPAPNSATMSSSYNRSSNHHRYAQIQGDFDDEELGSEQRTTLHEHRDGLSNETDPLYPTPPAAYYQRGIPQRITHWGKLIATLSAVTIACLSIAAVIDVSTPSFDGLEPGRDSRSVADGVLAAMDRSADPCENFYEYACGSWMRSTKLPSDKTSFEKSFSAVSDRIRLIVKDLLEGELQSTKDPVMAKAGVFYASCIDQHASGPINTLFLSPFRDLFSSASDARSFTKLMAHLNFMSSSTLFDMDVGLDDKDPTQYATFLGQASLGLPHRDNYLGTSDHDTEVRRHYLNFIESMLDPAGRARLIPRQDHLNLAKDILEFETNIANFSLPPEQMHDPDKIYNKRLINDMPSTLYLSEFFVEMGVDPKKMNNSVIIDVPPYFDSIASIMHQLDTDDKMRSVVQAYLAFHLAVLGAKNGLLGESAFGELFKFRQFMYGIKQMPEKWKTCQSLTNTMLGEAVGAAFVRDHFKDTQMNMAKTLSHEITKSFGETLKKLEWMDSETRSSAETKLGAINWKVGYSAKPDQYEDVNVKRDALADNVVECIKHDSKRAIARLGQPADKNEWFMNPQDVNAYYSPVRNEMVFPAGILQPPFFSDAFPDAMNYGSIGAVVGHEMSHGFDASGRKYDKDGRLSSWWSNSAATEYEHRSKCYIDLFDTFKPRDVDIHVSGKLTLNENIADTNGINVAYHAFKSLGNNSEDGLAPPNALLAKELTNDQLFFVSFAQTWCSLYRPEALKVQMMTDPHSPTQFRVLGPLSQSQIFADAFKCRNGTRYNPMTKCHLW